MPNLTRLIDQAKQYQNSEGRPWLEARVPVPYGDEWNKVQVFILEGSPVRGFLIAYSDIVIRLDRAGRRLKTWGLLDEPVRRRR